MLKLTRIRIRIASILYKFVKIFSRKDEVVVVRNRIKYALNLSEGIDLSIFLFGNFQKNVSDLSRFNLPRNMVVFDIGANIGSVTLKIAATYPYSKVYAFEPTDYAYEKLLKNLQLNSLLSKRIIHAKLYFSNTPDEKKDLEIYSSWRIDKLAGNSHPIHGGTKQSAAHVQTTTIDKYVELNLIDRLDFIKIDTDGHELPIIKGGEKSINKFRPIIIFEIGLYLLNERAISFNEYYDFFEQKNYVISDTKQRFNIELSNYNKIIPYFSTIDLVAIPAEKINAKAN